MKGRNKVYFYGSFPPKGKPAFGGGEIGNSRTVGILTDAGYDVSIIKKLRADSKASHAIVVLSYPLRTAYAFVVFFLRLLFGTRRSVVHISGFCGRTIYNEYALLRVSKLLRYRVVFELRGGGADRFYEEGSKSYKKCFEWIVSHSDFVFSQGYEIIPWMNSLSDMPVFYYPNFVSDDLLPSALVNNDEGSISLVYVGRIEPAKNVELIVEAASILQKTHPEVTLTLIGNGPEEYSLSVESKLQALLAPGSYEMFPACRHDLLPSYLKDKTFFVFPSEQPREGHSNAITEAMAYGVIPIASPQGYTRSVVGNQIMVVDEMSADAYADRMESIIASGLIDKLSQEIQQRVRTQYTESVVKKQLVERYATIFRHIIRT